MHRAIEVQSDDRPGEVVLSHAPDEYQQRGIDLLQVLRGLFRRWWIILLITAMITVVAFAAATTATRKYVAGTVIMPAESSVGSGSVNPLAGLGAVSSLVGGGDSSPKLDHFAVALNSVRLASRLEERHGLMKEVFAGSWNPTTGQWEEPERALGGLRRFVSGLLGRPGWRPPTVEDLAAYIEREVVVGRIGRTGFRKVTFAHTDKDFALRFLTVLTHEADEMLREDEFKRLTAMTDFIGDKVSEVTVIDLRNHFLRMQADTERNRIMLVSGFPYIIEMVDPPHVGDRPIGPSIPLWTIIGIIGGFFLGTVALLTWDATRAIARAIRQSPNA